MNLTTPQKSALKALAATKVYQDNAGRLYDTDLSVRTVQSLSRHGLASVTGSSRSMSVDGRTLRRVKVSGKGRATLNRMKG